MTFAQFIGLMGVAFTAFPLLGLRIHAAWCPMPDVMQTHMLRDLEEIAMQKFCHFAWKRFYRNSHRDNPFPRYPELYQRNLSGDSGHESAAYFKRMMEDFK